MIDREVVKRKVSQAIKQLPSIGIVYREQFNRYNEKEGYRKVTELIGVLYAPNSSATKTIVIKDNGKVLNDTTKNYLIVHDENSKKVLQTDILYVDEKFYIINDLGENMQIYNEMKIEEIENVKFVDGYISNEKGLYMVLDNEFDIKL